MLLDITNIMPGPSLGGEFPYSGLFTNSSTISLLHCYLGWIIVEAIYNLGLEDGINTLASEL